MMHPTFLNLFGRSVTGLCIVLIVANKFMLDGPMNLLIDAIDASQSHVEFEQNIVRCIVLTERCQSTSTALVLNFVGISAHITQHPNT